MDIRQSAIDRTAGFESFIGYFYLDTNGYVTVGYGHMVPDQDAAAALPLKVDGADATANAKRNEWTVINSKDAGHPASYYQQFTTLTLDESDAKTLLKGDLQVAAGNLLVRFPSLDDYPNDAQDALLDMIFNIGLTKFNDLKWPTLFAAVRKQDWKAAADASHRSDVSDDRNTAIHDLFVSAAGALTADLRAANILGQSLRDQMQELSRFVAGGQVLPKFFPHGITKVHLGLKAAGAEIDFDVEGPGTGSNASLRAARGWSSTAGNAAPGRLPIAFRRDLYEEGACLEYSWVPEGKRHVMRLEPLQQQDSESDPLDDVS